MTIWQRILFDWGKKSNHLVSQKLIASGRGKGNLLFPVQYDIKPNWICKYQRHGEKSQINEVIALACRLLAWLETNLVRVWIKMVVWRIFFYMYWFEKYLPKTFRNKFLIRDHPSMMSDDFNNLWPPIPTNVRFLPSNIRFFGVISDPPFPLKSDIINGHSLI